MIHIQKNLNKQNKIKLMKNNLMKIKKKNIMKKEYQLGCRQKQSLKN